MDRWGRGRKSEGSTADTARKRPERPWTAARTMEVLKAVSPRHCAATSAPRNCCFNGRAGQSHKDSVRCTAVEQQPEAKEVQLSQPSSTSLLMNSSGLRVQLLLPPLDLAWNPVMTHTGVCVSDYCIIVRFYIAPFSALEPTRCAVSHVTLNE